MSDSLGAASGVDGSNRSTSGTPTDVGRIGDRIRLTPTIDECIVLTSGFDPWHLQPVERLGVPSVLITGSAHGIRKPEPGSDDDPLNRRTWPATCFPSVATLASTWDEPLLERVGQALGAEAREAEVSILLGPAIDIKRSPLGGSGFDTFSEDPLLTGRLATALIKGIQSRGVGAVLQHLGAINQQTDRMRVSADIDPRALREIYLRAFEYVITEADPWMVMCASNDLNGVPTTEDHALLTDLLRHEWAYDGAVVSDWGAIRDRPASIAAGVDLQMPPARGDGPTSDTAVRSALASGRLADHDVRRAAGRVIDLVERVIDARAGLEHPVPPVDFLTHHELTAEAAAAGAVLLRNEPLYGRPLLPLGPEDDFVVVGEMAREPRYQGTGTSRVEPAELDDPLSCLRKLSNQPVAFEPGYTLDGDLDDDAELLGRAIDLVRRARMVVCFVGLPESAEPESDDRASLSLPDSQVALILEVVRRCEEVVVVMTNGSVVTTEWAHEVPAILEMWLAGQAVGTATADVLFGRRSPGGRLAETIPMRLGDTPAHGNFPGEFGHVRYGEGLLVGYRWYDTRRAQVAFPFGHGLSYTAFSYEDAWVTGHGTSAEVMVRVTNIGRRDGSEVIQIYVRDPESTVSRPWQELRAFAKVHLEPGESALVRLDLPERAFAHWHPVEQRWVIEGGAFDVAIGSSSRMIHHLVRIEIAGDILTPALTGSSTVAEWLADPLGARIMTETIRDSRSAVTLDPDLSTVVRGIPLSRLPDLLGGFLDHNTIEDMQERVAAASARALSAARRGAAIEASSTEDHETNGSAERRDAKPTAERREANTTAEDGAVPHQSPVG